MSTGANQPPAGKAAMAPAPTTVPIEQRDFRFWPYIAVVAPGGTDALRQQGPIRPHHIRTLPGGPLGNVAPVKTFEYRLAANGRSGDTNEAVKLDLPGSICSAATCTARCAATCSSPRRASCGHRRARPRASMLPEHGRRKLWHRTRSATRRRS
ncbi:MAG: hypothetical protein U1F49_11440 [Rubrivivax sp.]